MNSEEELKELLEKLVKVAYKKGFKAGYRQAISSIRVLLSENYSEIESSLKVMEKAFEEPSHYDN